LSLTLGTRLGPYDVTALLGEGGMGQVYRATDTRLKRQVALKILPPSVAADADRLARFQREAEVLASLNHPYIAGIYGLEESGGTTALVMELVEGEDLSQRIARGALPLDEALPIARQIAEALEAAHEQGIIHRDLKPANIKVRPDGTVKVLDFGLAKALDPNVGRGFSPADPGAAKATPYEEAATMTSPAMTQMGMILGTAAYMAPEQARGRVVDKRADIWAFGAVLFEMLTGTRAFPGEDITDTLALVVRGEPSWETLPATVPVRVRQVLRSCLQKDPKQRMGDMQSVRLALEGAFETAAPQATTSAASSPPPSRLPWVIAIAAVLGMIALAMPAIRHLGETPPAARAVMTTLLPPDNADYDFGVPYAIPAVSPDDTHIVYGAKGRDGERQLWLRRLDSPTAQPLPGTEDAATPFWSPDSRWVGFGQGATLKKVDIQGGPPVVVTALDGPLRGGSWNAEGDIVFGVTAGGQTPIFRVAASGGKAVHTAAKTTGSHRHPWFLPDGRHFLHTGATVDGDTEILVSSLDAPGESGKRVALANSPAAYSQGHLLYLRGNTLMAQPFDVTGLETTGEALPIAENIPTFTTGSRIPGFAVSASGLLVYQTGGAGTEKRVVWKDRQGNVLSKLGELHTLEGQVRLSPDFKRAAVTDFDRAGGNQDLWIYDIDRGVPTRFTFDPGRDLYPAWSPDGATMYFSSSRSGVLSLFSKPSNGTGTEGLIVAGDTATFPTSVSPDGSWLLFERAAKDTGIDLWVLPLKQAPGGPNPEPRPFLETPFWERNGQFSPDGRWVAYASNESGQTRVFAAPFPGPGGKQPISLEGGMFPRWRQDGKEIFYASPDGQLMAAEIVARNGTLNVGKAQGLFNVVTSSAGVGGGLTYDVSADGQKFLVVDDGSSDNARPLTLVQNWTALLRK